MTNLRPFGSESEPLVNGPSSFLLESGTWLYVSMVRAVVACPSRSDTTLG